MLMYRKFQWLWFFKRTLVYNIRR